MTPTFRVSFWNVFVVQLWCKSEGFFQEGFFQRTTTTLYAHAQTRLNKVNKVNKCFCQSSFCLCQNYSSMSAKPLRDFIFNTRSEHKPIGTIMYPKAVLWPLFLQLLGHWLYHFWIHIRHLYRCAYWCWCHRAGLPYKVSTPVGYAWLEENMYKGCSKTHHGCWVMNAFVLPIDCH